MKTKVVLFLILFLIQTLAYSEHWVTINPDPEMAKTLGVESVRIDTDSISKTGDIRW